MSLANRPALVRSVMRKSSSSKARFRRFLDDRVGRHRKAASDTPEFCNNNHEYVPTFNPATDWTLSGRITMKCPSDVAFITDHHVVLADSEAHRLSLFDRRGRLCGKIADNRVWPNCVAVTRNGKILVSDRKTSSVLVYDVSGELVHSFGGPLMTWEEQDKRPAGLAVDGRGMIYVSDTARNAINIFSEEGRKISEIGKNSALTQFMLPFYMCCDSRDRLYVSDNMSYSIKLFDSRGNFTGRIGSGQDWDWNNRQFACPYGVATDEYSNIYVADSSNSRVSVYDRNGEMKRHILTRPDGILQPCGLAVSPDSSCLIVTDSQDTHPDVRAVRLYSFKHTETTV